MSSSTTAASSREALAPFIRARLASVLAVAPLGVWLCVHLWNNLAAFQGAAAWQEKVTEYPHPFAQVFTGLLVLLPLALHTVWGIGRLFTSKPNNVRYGFYANLKYTLQRLAAIGVLLFVGAHLWLAMIHPRITTGRGEAFADITHEMHFNPPTLAVYVLGTLGVAYHLANGLNTAMMSWGVVSSRRALKGLEGATLVLFGVLLAMSWGVIYALYQAGAAT